MSNIRSTTIISSLLNYCGHAIGIVNIFFFINSQYFTPEEYGLTRIFIDIGLLVFSLVSFGMANVLVKFSPMYQRHYPQDGNVELLKYTLWISHIGLLILIVMSFFFGENIRYYFSTKSPLFNEYYFYLLPYAWGVVLLSIFEYYLYTINKAIVVSLFKEIIQRFLVFILVIFFVLHFFNVSVFLKLFAFVPLILFGIFAVYFFLQHRLKWTIGISSLTHKMKKKMALFSFFNYAAFATLTISGTIDSFLIAGISKNGLADAGVFTFCGFIISFMQVPQRYLNNIASVKIYEALQLKNIPEVQRIYYRSSINLVIFGLLILLAVLLGFDALFQVFNINPIYQSARTVILILGLSKLFDMLTSVNLYIIIGSKYWKYDLYFNIFLLLLAIPFNYFLIRHYGILGAAYSNLIMMIIVNTARCWFIYHKLKIHPLHVHFIGLVLIAFALFVGVEIMLNFSNAYFQLFVKPSLFCGTFLLCIYIFKFSPDLDALVKKALQRLKAQA